MTLDQRLAVGALLFCMSFAHARNSSAQGTAAAFGELAGRLKGGTTVYLTDDAGVKRQGKIVRLSPSNLELSINGKPEVFAEDQVRTIAERRRSTAKGAKIGLAVGAGMALFGALNTSDCKGCHGAPDALVPVTIGALIGMATGIGAAIGATLTHERLVYERPDPNAKDLSASDPASAADGLVSSAFNPIEPLR